MLVASAALHCCPHAIDVSVTTVSWRTCFFQDRDLYDPDDPLRLLLDLDALPPIEEDDEDEDDEDDEDDEEEEPPPPARETPNTRRAAMLRQQSRVNNNASAGA